MGAAHEGLEGSAGSCARVRSDREATFDTRTPTAIARSPGVLGVVHKRAGPELAAFLKDSAGIGDVIREAGAAVSPPFGLKARRLVHAAGGAGVYRSALATAEAKRDRKCTVTTAGKNVKNMK